MMPTNKANIVQKVTIGSVAVSSDEDEYKVTVDNFIIFY